MKLQTNLDYIKKQIRYRKQNRSYEKLPIGSAIRFRRQQLNLTLEEAALDISSVSYLSKLENNLIIPSQTYIEKYEKRLGLSLSYESLDSYYQDHLNLSLRAILLDFKMQPEIEAHYDARDDHQAYILMMAYVTTQGDYQKTHRFDKRLRMYIQNLTDIELSIYLACLSIAMIDEEQYGIAHELIRMIPIAEDTDQIIQMIEIKYRLKVAFHMGMYAEIENLYPIYEKTLNQMQAYELLKNSHQAHLVFQAGYQDMSFIQQKIEQIPSMDEEHKAYIQAISWFQHQRYEDALKVSQAFLEIHEHWYRLHLFALDQSGEHEAIKQVLNRDLHLSFKKVSTTILHRYLYIKHLEGSEALISHIRSEFSFHAYVTDDYQVLSHIYLDGAKTLSSAHFYKEAYRMMEKLHLIRNERMRILPRIN